jgi:hypothetical protein
VTGTDATRSASDAEPREAVPAPRAGASAEREGGAARPPRSGGGAQPGEPFRVAILAERGDPVAARWAALTGALLVERGRHLLEMHRASRPEVVHVRLPVPRLGRAALACTLAGVRAVVVTPLGAAATLPAWERRFHRWVHPTQDEARGWRGAGIALGRQVVLPDADDGALESGLRAVWAESARMG